MRNIATRTDIHSVETISINSTNNENESILDDYKSKENSINEKFDAYQEKIIQEQNLKIELLLENLNCKNQEIETAKQTAETLQQENKTLLELVKRERYASRAMMLSVVNQIKTFR
ncbi:hypothetical protein QEN19_000341 [Hanseniaspora menglaensis]